MREGWFGDDYLMLFDRAELPSITDRYGVSAVLPGFTVLGLCNWDDFILRDAAGPLRKVPTLPLDRKLLADFTLGVDDPTLQPDVRFSRKIKWCVKPLIFGGDPQTPDNVIWVDLDEHIRLVNWWNAKYHGRTPPNRES